jgi:hypothetical protein
VQTTSMLSNTFIGAPHLSEFPDFGHKETVGKATCSIGNEVESRISMTGSSIQPAKISHSKHRAVMGDKVAKAGNLEKWKRKGNQ